jgi:hypothetical protein
VPRPKRTNTALPFIAEVNLRGKGCASFVRCAAHHKQLSTAAETIPVSTFDSARTHTAALVKLVHDGRQLFAGHNRCYGTSMSAPPSTADIRQGNGYVSFVPKHKVAALQPAARGQEPRGRKPAEKTALAGLRAAS